MNEFSGIGMFEADNTPDSAVYGTVNLEMFACNLLNATIETDDQTFDMVLTRIDDVTYTQNCVD